MTGNSDRNSLPSPVLLAIASGLSSFGLSIILPALPAVAERYGTDLAGAQFVVSAYLLGLAITQPVVGFLTDLIGRRVVILSGFSVLIVSCFAANWAPSLEVLALLRFLQAAGVATGTVVCRAVIRDTYPPAEGARAMSFLTMGLGVAPIIAPILGGWLFELGSVEWVFIANGVIAMAIWLLLFLTLPETLASDAPRPRVDQWLGSYGTLFRSRVFLGYTAVYGFIQGSFFAFLAVGAAVFEDSFGLGPRAFGAVWGAMGFSYVIGAMIGGRISNGPRRPLLLPVGMWLTLGFGVLLSVLVLSVGAHAIVALPPMFVMMTVSGCVTPLVMAGAVYQHPSIAGTAAGLSSALSMVSASSFTVMAGYLYDGRFGPIALLMTSATILTFLGWLLVSGSRGRELGAAPGRA